MGFAGALSSLKRRGSLLLVVGDLPEDACRRLTEEMLGERSATPPRRRLLVTTRQHRASALERLDATGPTTPAFARLLVCETDTRSASADAAEDESPASVRERQVPRDPGRLGPAVGEELEALAAGGLDPAELRAGIDPGVPVVDRNRLLPAFRFVHALGGHLRRHRGIGYVHLPHPLDDTAVATLRPLFDATVELDVRGGDPVSRWHLRESGLTSGWLGV